MLFKKKTTIEKKKKTVTFSSKKGYRELVVQEKTEIERNIHWMMMMISNK